MSMKLMTNRGSWMLAAAFGLTLAGGNAQAAGDSGDKAGPTCARGEVYDSRSGKCVKQQSGVLPDSILTQYAYSLAKADRFDEAIDVLNLLKNPNTAKALNYRGYAMRKMGKTDEGIAFYLQSVKRAPRYAQVREYLGEAYVIKGDLAAAKAQLAVIKGICGTKCEEYEDLAEAIEKGPPNAG
jgi:tetratricopeptide (TPR) repeat protein